MNNTRLFVSIALATLLAAGCGKDKDKQAAGEGDKGGAAADKEPAQPKAPEKPIELTATLDIGAAVSDPDDKRYEGLKVKAPEGAKVNGNNGMALTVEYNDKSYEIRFEFDDEGAVAKAKEKASKDTFDKLVKFHVDDPTAVLWESSSELGGENNFSFVATVKYGEKNLLCKNKGYGQFTKAEAEALLKSCQSASK